ncbi:MAG: hypothetical protein ACE14V_02890 [bacterium]
MEKRRRTKVFRIILIIIAILIISPLLYLTYDRSLMPPVPDWTSPSYIPGETWVQYATRYLETSNKPNALAYYLKALSLYQSKPMNEAYFELDTIRRYGWTKSYPKAELALQANSESIQEIILGAQMKQCELPPNPYTLSAPVPHFLNILYLSKLIIAAGKKYEQQNQSQKALLDYLYNIQFAKDFGQKDQPLLSDMISSNIILINTQAILQLITQNKLTDQDYRFIIIELSRIEREQTTFAQALESDYRICYFELYKDSKSSIKFANLMNQSYLPIEEEPISNTIIASYIFLNRGRVLRNYRNYINDTLGTMTTNPYSAYMKINWELRVPQDYINHKFLVTNDWKYTYTRLIYEVATVRLAQIQAAIQLYYLKRKQWPKELNDLKTYVSPMPVDPFNDQSFLWAVDSSGKPFSYSVGPDFKDNAVKVVYDPTNGVMSVGDIRP